MTESKKITPSPMKTEIPERVAGPVSLTAQYSKSLNKWVYIFGDIHKKESVCVPENSIHIQELIQKMIDNSDSIVDVYLESAFLQKDTKRDLQPRMFTFSYILDVEKNFEACLRSQNKECKNARFHYTDVRSGTPSTEINALTDLSDTLSLYFKYENRIMEKEDPELRKPFLSIITKQLQTILQIIKNKNARTLILKILQDLKITKQLKNISDPSIAKALETHYLPLLFTKFPFSDQELIQDIYETLVQENGDEPSGILLDALIDLHKSLLFFEMLFMDLYLMARLFRSFSKTAPGNKNIIYAGERHVQSYRRVLEKLGFKLVLQRFAVDETNFQCLDISGIEPFFSI